jgi:hypothetical protein
LLTVVLKPPIEAGQIWHDDIGDDLGIAETDADKRNDCREGRRIAITFWC